MEELINWYNENDKILHPVLVAIHPLIDGNGRTARLLLNLELMKSGFPPIVIN